MTEPPPIPEPPPVPPPVRPPDGGRIALTILGTLAASFVFSMGVRLACADLVMLAGYSAITLWIAPIVVLAGAALYAMHRRWKWVAIALWIYVGLGLLTSVACGAILGGGF